MFAVKCSETGTAPGWRSRLSSTDSGSSESSSFEALVECALGSCFTKPDLFDATGRCSMIGLNRPPDDGVPNNGLSRPLSEYLGRSFEYLGRCSEYLGRSFEYLGRSFEYLGRSFEYLRRCFSRLSLRHRFVRNEGT